MSLAAPSTLGGSCMPFDAISWCGSPTPLHAAARPHSLRQAARGRLKTSVMHARVHQPTGAVPPPPLVQSRTPTASFGCSPRPGQLQRWLMTPGVAPALRIRVHGSGPAHSTSLISAVAPRTCPLGSVTAYVGSPPTTTPCPRPAPPLPPHHSSRDVSAGAGSRSKLPWHAESGPSGLGLLDPAAVDRGSYDVLPPGTIANVTATTTTPQPPRTSHSGPQARPSSSNPITVPAPPRRGPTGTVYLAAQPATCPQDFSITVPELGQLVQDAFDRDGQMSGDVMPAELSMRLRTSLAAGLTDDTADAQARRAAFGTNRLPPARTVSFWELVSEALEDFTVRMLLVAGTLSLGLGLMPASNGGADGAAAVTGSGAATTAAALAGLAAAGVPAAGPLAETAASSSSDWIEGVAILLTVLVVVGVSSTTNYQKEAKFQQLSVMKDDIEVRVVRDNSERRISVFDLMVGDLVVVEAGDILPADGMLVEGGEIKLDQSHLTGESDDVCRSPYSAQLVLAGSKVLEGYGRMLVLAVGPNSQQGKLNALVQEGKRGTMRTQADEAQQPEPQPPTTADAAVNAASADAGAVSAISVGNGGGQQQQQGAGATAPNAVAASAAVQQAPASAAAADAPPAARGGGDAGADAKEGEGESAGMREETFLTQKLQVLAQQIGGVGVAAAVSVLAINAGRLTWDLVHEGGAARLPGVSVLQAYLDQVITSITILVVAVPEGLPLAVTLALAFSVQRMLADNNLVRHISALETMASATTICSDKTGTLTQNCMSAVRIWAAGRHFRIVHRPRPPLPPPAGSATKLLHQHMHHPHATQQQQHGAATAGATAGTAAQPKPGPASAATSGSSTDPSAASGSSICISLSGGSSGSSVDALWPIGSSVMSLVLDEEGEEWVSAAAERIALPAAYAHPPASLQPMSPLTAGPGGNGTSAAAAAAAAAAEAYATTAAVVAAATSFPVPAPGSATAVCLPCAAPGAGAGADALGPPLALDLPSFVEELLAQSIVLNSTASLHHNVGTGLMERSGNRTECALLEMSLRLGWQHQGVEALRAKLPVMRLLPFTSLRKRMTAVVRLPPAAASSAAFQAAAWAVLPADDFPDGDDLPTTALHRVPLGATRLRVLTKGAAEIVLERCARRLGPDGGAMALGPGARRALLRSFSAGGSGGNLRLLALAYRDLELQGEKPLGSMTADEIEQDLTLIAVVGLQDPLRPDVPDAIRQCERAGITVRMLTGDNAFTAASIAQQCGLLPAGQDLETLLASCSHLAAKPQAQPAPAGQQQQQGPVVPATIVGKPALSEQAVAYAAAAADVMRGDGNGDGNGAADASGAAAALGQMPALARRSTMDTTMIESDIETSDSSSVAGSMMANASMESVTPGATPALTASAARLPLPPSTNGSESDTQEPAATTYQKLQLQHQRFQQQAAAAAAVAAGSAPSSLLDALGSAAASASYSLLLARLAALPAAMPLVLEGGQLRRLIQLPDGSYDKQAFLALWPRLRVLARCSPTDKHLIVMALKQLRAEGLLQEVVAMTGDGTNDAPALTAADVGFAMNSGTPIARDAADILLLDDSFSSIVAAVMWGRNVYASITKFLQFQLTANVVAVATACVGAVALNQSPLCAVQMLWVNLIMDSLASLALATEVPTEAVLDLPPCRQEQPLVSATVAKHIAGQAAFQLAVLYAILALHGDAGSGDAALAGIAGVSTAAAGASAGAAGAALGAAGLGGDAAAWWHSLVGALDADLQLRNTMVFNTFVMMQLFNQVNCRRVRDEADVTAGVLQQPLFLVITSVEALLQVLIVQYGGAAFQTTPLSPSQWALCVGIGATTLLVRAGLRAVPTPQAEMQR